MYKQPSMLVSFPLKEQVCNLRVHSWLLLKQQVKPTACGRDIVQHCLMYSFDFSWTKIALAPVSNILLTSCLDYYIGTTFETIWKQQWKLGSQ